MRLGASVTAGVTAWGTYLPYWRLERKPIADALGVPSGRGTRSVASYDEDTTTLALAAARRLFATPEIEVPDDLIFSTPDPPYLDKTNATTIHAALGLSPRVGAYDLCGSSRSAVAALFTAISMAPLRRTAVVTSDLRTGLAGGVDERDGGDGAAAFLCGPQGAVAELLGRASASDELLDRWRVPGERESHQWEERFGEQMYVPLARDAFAEACKEAGVTAGSVDHMVVTGLHARAVRSVRGSLGVTTDAIRHDRAEKIGNLGAAQFGLSLADVLETASPGQVVALVHIGDGADALVLRTTEELPRARARREQARISTVGTQSEGGRKDLSYLRFITWRGQLRREPPRRPDPERPGAPTMHRSEGWKYAFEASRCLVCGFRHLPPTRVCLECHSVDQMAAERLADTLGTVATFTIDRLAYSLSPPVVGVVVDFDGGGRYRCEMTDVDPDAVVIGDRIEMTFRRVYTASGVHNYFWKARPLEKRDLAPQVSP